MGFIEQMLGMETPPKANPYGRQLMDRGSVTAEPAPEPTLENALMNSPLNTFLQYKAADVPGKLQSGLQAVGDSYKKNIDYMLDPRLSQQALMGNQEEMRRMVRPAMELALDAMGGGFLANGVTAARKGGFEVGMFAGRQAKTADKAALETAQDLTAKGADRNQVWKETGWYEDVDGQWKFEIDDSASFLETPAGAPKGYQRLQHDELQGAYPGMWGETQQSISRGKSAGNYRPEFRTVTAKGPNNAERRSVANHEFQHATQREEGFATGGSPDQFGMTQGEFDEGVKHLEMTIAGRRWIEYQRHVGQDADWLKFRNIFKENMGKFPPIDAKNAPDNMYEELVKTEDQLRGMVSYASDPYESYRRLAGEAEARNVQTRMDYTPEQRRATPPWDTLDVPEDELIVRMGGGGRSMSDSRAKVGGEMGVNGFNYKGGQFLPSTDAPPGTWRVKKGKKSTTISGTRELVEPGKIENAPTPFSRSLMQLMGSGGEVYGGKAHLLDNPGYWNYMGGDTPGKLRYKDLAESASEYTVQDLVDMYNKGMRWIELDPVDGVEIVARGIKK